jgi:hypothetical protein
LKGARGRTNNVDAPPARQYLLSVRILSSALTPPPKMQQSRPVRAELLAAAAFIVSAALLSHLLFSWMGFTPTDEGFTLAHSRRLLDGQVPHRDFIIIRPFFSPLVHVPFVLFGGGHTLWLSRLFVWFQLACVAWLWVAVVNRLMKSPFGVADRLFVSLAAFAATAHTKHITAWHTIDGLFFTSAGLALCVGERRAAKLAGYFLVGLSPLCKQSFVFVAPLSLLILGDWRRLRYWGAAAAPGVCYLVYLLSAGALRDAFSQLTSHTELLSVGLLAYLSKRMALSAALGYASFRLALAPPPVGEKTKGPAATLMIFWAPLLGAAVGLWYGAMLSASFFLFGFLLGAAACLLTDRRAPRGWGRVSLLVLLTGWSVSLSAGYNSPALASGPVLAALAACVFSLRGRGPVLRYSLVAASLLVALSFGVARTRYVYRERPASQLTMPLGGVLRGGEGVYTNRNTFEFMSDLKGALEFVEGERSRYAILPDVAAYWVKSPQPNPLPADWPQAIELSNPALMGRFVAAMEAARGDTVFVVQKVEAEDLADGFEPLPSNDYYEAARYARTHFVKIHETRYFELYR